jgi:nicotinamide-nucleotide amidase
VTYTNASKTRMLGVPAHLLETYGAVSAEVAEAMAKGALERSNASVALSSTGIAGPTGGSEEKPVGLVYIGVADGQGVKSHRHLFSGDRDAIRLQTADAALKLVERRFEK